MYLDAAVHLESAVVLLTEADDGHDDEDVAGNVAQQLLELVGISGLAVGDHQRHENRAPEIPRTHAHTQRTTCEFNRALRLRFYNDHFVLGLGALAELLHERNHQSLASERERESARMRVHTSL